MRTSGPHAQIEAARDGDPAAITALYDEYADIVLAVAYRVLQSVDDAEDVVQDVFLGLSRAIRTYEGRGSFTGWIKKVAMRTALMRLRRAQSRREQVLGEETVGRRGSPTDRLALEDALERLPESLRLVFVLKEIEGYSHEEIASALGIGVGASKIRLHRARRQLQKDLKDQ